MAGLIDPTKTGKYPVILGDSLRGKTVNDVFTAIQYNHKPALSSASAPSSARLRPSTPGKTSSYDLTYTDNGQRYAFSGPRNTDENKYVLYFNPVRKAFILDKVDSTFNMNATRLPGNPDPESLRRLHPHIDSTPKPASKPSKPSSAKSGPLKPPPKPKAKPILPPKKKELPNQRTKPEKKAPAKPISLALPVAETPEEKEKRKEKDKQREQEMEREKEKKKAKEKEKEKPKQYDYEDEDDDDDDGGLLVEYPDGDPRSKPATSFSPAFPSVRRFDDFMNQRESEEDDGDSDELEPKASDFQFPAVGIQTDHLQFHKPELEPEPEADAMEDDLEADLAKEMEIAFEDLENSHSAPIDAGDESEISEED